MDCILLYFGSWIVWRVYFNLWPSE